MGLRYIRDTYGVPAKRGARVKYSGLVYGTITSVCGARIRIRLDGDTFSLPFHPTYSLEYLAAKEEGK